MRFTTHKTYVFAQGVSGEKDLNCCGTSYSFFTFKNHFDIYFKTF